MRSWAGMILVLAVPLVGASKAPAQKIPKENPYYLRSDARLQASLNVAPERPKLLHIVEQLRDATGLDIEVAGGLREHDPDFGHIQPSKRGYRAWQIMEMVSKKDLQGGYWEKTFGGYRLAGTSTLAPRAAPEPGWSSGHYLMAVNFSVLLLLIAAIVSRRWGAKASAGQTP